jgi:16S rRNA (guanine966-N2)-methyltransferase
VTRIIAGIAKGHRLRTPATSDTRPTTDRVREATFSAIADWAGTAGATAEQMLVGLSFLDLFAGSGAVALEAASRGAGPVTAVESVASVAAIARDNARTTRLAVNVAAAEASKWLAGPASTRFDVVWADPPYAYDNQRLAAIAALIEERWLAENGLLVLERSSRDQPPDLPEALSVRWHRRYGETTVYFAMKESSC